MGKLAFVFAGQGDQSPGMGLQLFERYKEAKEVFALCDRIRPGTSAQCFSGTKEELRETENTQPCLFAVEMAAAGTLQAKGVLPDAVAGYSLGEVAACTCAGMFTLEEGFRLVIRRGEFMQRAAGRIDTFMAAVLGLESSRVARICASLMGVYAVNFNSPRSVTVAGLSRQRRRLEERIKAAGGRFMLLPVGGAFHSPFMGEASESFEKLLKETDYAAPAIPVYSDVTAKPYRKEDELTLLARQIMSPVRWEDLVKNMIADGVDRFIEIGPGRTLTGMIKRIDPGVQALTVMEALTAAEELAPRKRK